MSAKVSVALCTFNGERFLRQQLESIFTQSRIPDELVVSDDGSTDRTIAVLEEFLATLPAIARQTRVRTMTHPARLGVAGNFSLAIEACTGDIVVLADQDDVWHRDKVETLVAVLESRAELSLVHSDARLIDGAGEVLDSGLFDSIGLQPQDLERIHEGDAFSLLLRRNFVTGATVAFRRDLIEKAVPIPPSWIHDEWLAILAAGVSEIDVVEEKLIDYRQHSANVIGVRKLVLGEAIRKVFEARGSRIEKLASRARELVLRLEQVDPPLHDSVLRNARYKAEHEAMRSALPAFRLARIPAVLRALAGGGYRAYGRGLVDVARDLLQKT